MTTEDPVDEVRGWFQVLAAITAGALIAAGIVLAWRAGWILDLIVWWEQLWQ